MKLARILYLPVVLFLFLFGGGQGVAFSQITPSFTKSKIYITPLYCAFLPVG
jgi:hypothetical protein